MGYATQKLTVERLQKLNEGWPYWLGVVIDNRTLKLVDKATGNVVLDLSGVDVIDGDVVDREVLLTGIERLTIEGH